MQKLAVNQDKASGFVPSFGANASERHQQSRLQLIGATGRFQRNQTVFAEGDDADYVFKVLSGAVRLCKVLADGRRQIAEFALPGDFFGIEWLDEYSLTAEALSDLSVVKYERKHLDKAAQEERSVRQELSSTLRQGLWAAQKHLIMLGRQSASERIASFLLQLMERSKSANPVVHIPMNRQDIADYLGLTIETVCRVLSAFKRDRLIAIPNRNQIRLINVTALQDMADGEELAAA